MLIATDQRRAKVGAERYGRIRMMHDRLPPALFRTILILVRSGTSRIIIDHSDVTGVSF